jgi:hypothetical protein
MGQINFITSLVLIGLFTIALLGFALNFASDTGADISLANDAQIMAMSQGVTANTTAFTSSSNQTYYNIVGATVTTGDTTPSGQQFALTPINAIGTVRNIVLVGYHKIFGTDSGFEIFILTFIAMLTFIIGLYIWKTWKGGMPD